MKIKFLKEFRVINVNTKDTGLDTTIEAGEINDFVNDESAQWLIDNGFAEEVIEPGWRKPRFDEMYYCLDSAGTIMFETWCNDELDESRYSTGNCFKTSKAAERYRDYLKAIATVHQDEGVLTPEHVAKSYTGYYVCINENSQLRTDLWAFADEVNRMPANIILFDTIEHAQASLDEHQDEWDTIANYDWSRE